MNDEKQNQRWHPITWVVIVLVIGVLLAIAIPSFVKSRNTAAQEACIHALREVTKGMVCVETNVNGGSTWMFPDDAKRHMEMNANRLPVN